MEIANRRNTYSYKWDVDSDVLPMWVADMDFKLPKSISDVVSKRLEIGAYGYSCVPSEYYNAYIRFFRDMHDLSLEYDWFIFSTGVVPSISSAVRHLTNEGDMVCVISPCYNIFYNSILNNKRIVNESKLILDDTYSIDFKDLEERLSKSRMLILSNPQNPTGNIWSYEDLSRIVDLCNKYNVYLISDEIHCDITTPGIKYTPIFSLDKDLSRVIMLASASKCYNMAGFQASVALVKDPDLRYRVYRAINTDECGENNFFACDAHIEALDNCRDWLFEMNSYVYENKRIMYEYIEKNMPKLHAIKSDSLYLLWVDIRGLTPDDIAFTKYLLEKERIMISNGSQYGESGKGFIRINLATSKENIIRCLEGIYKTYSAFMKI